MFKAAAFVCSLLFSASVMCTESSENDNAFRIPDDAVAVQGFEESALMPEYSVFISHDNYVLFLKKDGSASVRISLLKPQFSGGSLRQYTKYLMAEKKGSSLQDEPSLRGCSFIFSDYAPCSAFVSFFDGVSYLYTEACGKVGHNDTVKILYLSSRMLHLEDMLRKTGSPATYY